RLAQPHDDLHPRRPDGSSARRHLRRPAGRPARAGAAIALARDPVTTRRRFLVALGAGVLAGPRDALAQAQSQVARVGFLSFVSRETSLETGRYQAFVEGMRERGYVEGKTLVIEARYADGSAGRLPALAADLVRLKMDVIVVSGTAATRAMLYATTT